MAEERPRARASPTAPRSGERGEGGKRENLRDNRLGPGQKKIYRYIKIKRYIRVFENLRDNRLGPEGGTAVAAGLHRLTGLTKLEVRCA